MDKYHDIELKGVHGGIKDILDIMGNYNVVMPCEFVLISKGLSILGKTSIGLDPEFDTMATFEPYTKNSKKKVKSI